LDREPRISLLITFLYALFSIITPLGFVISVFHPQSYPFPAFGLVLFILGYLGFFAVAFLGFALDGPLRGSVGRDAKNPTLLHAFQIRLIAQFLPVALFIGFI
jgi:hypothetical protein